MNQRWRRALPVTAVACLALIVGSVGTATASGLSIHNVKKIAGRVVKKKAKHLSVARADTAKSASTLAGLPPSAYRNQAFTVALTPSIGVNAFNKALPTTIPNGTYLASIYVTANESGTSGSQFFCELNSVDASEHLIDAYGALYQSFAILSASRVITVDKPLNLFCNTLSGNFSTPVFIGYSAPQISFVRMDTVTALAPAS